MINLNGLIGVKLLTLENLDHDVALEVTCLLNDQKTKTLSSVSMKKTAFVAHLAREQKAPVPVERANILLVVDNVRKNQTQFDQHGANGFVRGPFIVLVQLTALNQEHAICAETRVQRAKKLDGKKRKRQAPVQRIERVHSERA